MSKKSGERYKLLANTFGSAAVGSAVLGFIKPEVESVRSPDPRTIYDPYLALLVAIALLGLALWWIGGMDDA